MMTKLGLPLELVATIVGHTAGGAQTAPWFGITFTTNFWIERRLAWRNGTDACARSWPTRAGKWSSSEWIKRAKIMQPESTT